MAEYGTPLSGTGPVTSFSVEEYTSQWWQVIAMLKGTVFLDQGSSKV